MYFGPAPALLRLPTAALTDSLDGRTGNVSMLLAFAVAMVALGRIGWRVRRWARGDAPVDRGDELLAGAVAFVLGTGTTIVFLGVGPYVYHEAILWGVALAFAAFAAILAWIEQPRPALLAAAGVLTLLALLSRLAVGIGPAAALALLAVAVAVARVWPRARRAVARVGLADPAQLGWGVVGALAAAVAVPLAVYAVVNYAKFGTLFSVPYDHQAANAVVPGRRAILAANGGTLGQRRRAPDQRRPVPAPGCVPARRRVAVDPIALVAAERDRRRALRHARLHLERHRRHARPLRARDRRHRRDRARRRACGRGHAPLARGAGRWARRARSCRRWSSSTSRPRYTADFLPFLVLLAFAGLYAFVRWARSTGERRGVVVVASVGAGRARALELRRQRVDGARLPARSGAGADASSIRVADGRGPLRSGACGTPGGARGAAPTSRSAASTAPRPSRARARARARSRAATASGVVDSGAASMPSVIFVCTNPGRTIITFTPVPTRLSPRPWKNASMPAFDEP